MVHETLSADNIINDAIPVIDFSREDLKPGSSAWVSTGEKIRYALEENGCFIAKHNQLSSQLADDIFSQSKDLFELPAETKVKNKSDEPYRGYIGPNLLMPLYESLAIDKATVLEEVHKFMNLMWPDGKTNFCEAAHTYACVLASMNETILRMVFESYGTSKHYDKIVSFNTHLIRFLRYNDPQDSESNLRFAAHTDINFTTFVHQNQLGGLEVETKDGKWVALEASPSQVLFMAGDGMKVWSNDRIKACNHRVKLSAGNGPRYSLGLFTWNNGVIEVPEELVDDNHPLAYKPFDTRGFVRFYASGEAKKHSNPLKAYCGVRV